MIAHFPSLRAPVVFRFPSLRVPVIPRVPSLRVPVIARAPSLRAPVIARVPSLCAIFLAGFVAGCAAAPRTAIPVARAVDDDLVALLPTGAEAVIDLDVEQLRAWPPAARLRSDLPGDARGRIDRLGVDLLADVDRLAVGLTGAGSDGAVLTIVARGRFAPARLREALAAGDGPLVDSDYHGSRVVDGASASFAILTPRTVAFGARAEVRRVIDVALGNDEGMRRDRAMEELFARLPSAKQGRPAALAAIRVVPALAARLTEAGLGDGSVRWVGAAIAVGDGIDLGLVAGSPDASRALDLSAALQRVLDDLRGRSSLRVLGLAPFVDVVKMATRREEVHLAFRLEERRLDILLPRIERLLHAAQAER